MRASPVAQWQSDVEKREAMVRTHSGEQIKLKK